MSYTVAKIEGHDAQRLADNERPSFFNSGTDEWITYTDELPSEFVGSSYDIITISEAQNDSFVQVVSASGTFPIIRGRKPFPR